MAGMEGKAPPMESRKDMRWPLSWTSRFCFLDGGWLSPGASPAGAELTASVEAPPCFFFISFFFLLSLACAMTGWQ